MKTNIIVLDRIAFIKRIWERAESRNLYQYQEKVEVSIDSQADQEIIDGLAKEACKRNIFYVIRNYGKFFDEPKHRESKDATFNAMKLAVHSISLFTPREFMTIFPIAKEFDGKRWCVKDYFSTMEYIDSVGINNKITEPMRFLFEYHNWEIFDFMMNFTDLMDDEREELTGISIFEQYCIDNGIDMYSMPGDY